MCLVDDFNQVYMFGLYIVDHCLLVNPPRRMLLGQVFSAEHLLR
jgi:hypothetical protein